MGNRGLNTAYQANDRVSSVLLSIQLDRSEDSLLIEAINDGNRLWPRATRRELSRHLRSIRREFPTNNDYARASLDEILGEKELAMAGRWEATESQSGLLLSQSDGTHRFSPLPRIAQISPMRGAVVGDFNGDGHADLYTVQNADTAAPSIGRYDGGVSQLMHGQGDGRLSVVSPQDSGLVVTGNAAALITTDTDADGWPDFLVTRSDGPALAFKNHGISNRRMTSIALHGPVGNPTAIGARIIIHRENGAQQLTEFSAGSGYLSQSAARMFVAELPENPVKEITVHWPDGVQSSHQLSYDVSQNRFTHPLRR